MCRVCTAVREPLDEKQDLGEMWAREVDRTASELCPEVLASTDLGDISHKRVNNAVRSLASYWRRNLAKALYRGGE
jgi:hypothetical protein